MRAPTGPLTRSQRVLAATNWSRNGCQTGARPGSKPGWEDAIRTHSRPTYKAETTAGSRLSPRTSAMAAVVLRPLPPDETEIAAEARSCLRRPGGTPANCEAHKAWDKGATCNSVRIGAPARLRVRKRAGVALHLLKRRNATV